MKYIEMSGQPPSLFSPQVKAHILVRELTKHGDDPASPAQNAKRTNSSCLRVLLREDELTEVFTVDDVNSLRPSSHRRQPATFDLSHFRAEPFAGQPSATGGATSIVC